MPEASAGKRKILLAAFYGVYLREHGHTPEDAAALVIERYPCMAKRLQKLASRKEVEQHEAAAAASAGQR